MPYTPPSHRSPTSSTTTSPETSRRGSFHAHTTTTTRPSLPRSASYLTRHRRTPSAPASSAGYADRPTPSATSEDLKGMVSSTAVRQSPPPVTDSRRIPSGAILSPPASSPELSASDDEDSSPAARGRQMEELKALHEAISRIPQHRQTSPDRSHEAKSTTPPPPSSIRVAGIPHSFSTGSLDQLAAAASRRSSHSRSATEPSIQIDKSAEPSLTGSEEDSEGETQRKPPMVRKKSGELVRPALRGTSKRRPLSMPGTPTFSKAVHFDSHLEHVRHFLQVDRPLAVSAGSSPVDNYESDSEYPFSGADRSASRSPAFEWEITLSNFPAETPFRKAQPVRLDRVWLSNDQKCLIGSVSVANLAFQKQVTCRFTLDYWKTTSEVSAEYVNDVRQKDAEEGRDRFNFSIKLSDISNLESKTLYFCIRYNVIGQELWDNNGGMNFQVDFRKKPLQQNGKGGLGVGARSNGLPKSSRRSNPSTSPRPKSMPVSIDDSDDGSAVDFSPDMSDFLREPSPRGLRLKGVKSKSTTSIPSDNLAARLSAPSGQAFANRYDFGASLTAAVQAAKDAMSGNSDGLYMKPHRPSSAIPLPPPPSKDVAKGPVASHHESVSSRTNTTATPSTSKTDLPSTGSIASSSYEELVNKYCFFGSKPRQGASTGSPLTASSTASSGSPVHTTPGSPRPHEAQHHTLNRNGSPYPHPAAAIATALSADRQGSPETSQSLLTNGSPSPASLVGSFSPFANSSPDGFAYTHMQDRFPFSGAETHAATAIKG